MNQKAKAPCFRGHVRKTVSPFGITTWLSEVRTPKAFTELGQTASVGEAIARAIETAYTPAPAVVVAGTPEPLRQAA